MPSGLAWLSGLSAGASTLGKGMDEKSILAEQRKRQQIQDALAELSKFDELGASVAGPDALDKLRLSQMDQMDPMAPLRGGPSLTSQRDQQRQHGDAKTITLPDGRTILIDPSQSRSARSADAAARALATREAGQDERQGKRLDADFNRQMALERLRDQRQNETFTGSPLNLGAEPGTPAGVYLRGSRGTLQRVGAAPPEKGMTEYQREILDLRKQQGGGGGRMAASLQAKLVANDRLGVQIDDVLKRLQDAVTGRKNVTGPIIGRTPGNVSTEGIGFDKTMQLLRRDLNAIENQRLYDNSGKAVTVAEYARQIGAMPSSKVDEGLNLAGLKRLREILNEESRLIRIEAGGGTASTNPGDFVNTDRKKKYER